MYFCRPENDVKLSRLKRDVDALAPASDHVRVEESAAEWLRRRHMDRHMAGSYSGTTGRSKRNRKCEIMMNTSLSARI